MENLKCLSTIITNNLAVHIDISDNKSWNLNTGHTVISLSKWKNAISDDITLPDFGLTAFDNGRSNQLNSSLLISANDLKLKLYPIGYNNATGGTFFTGLNITPVISGATPFVGKYFDLNGGYLQGFFKLKDYNYETLPARFSAGFTIETIINVKTNSFNDGYYYYMGTRAEDKFLPIYLPESGRTTSEGNPLDSYSLVDKVLGTITTGTSYTQTVREINDGQDIFDNVMAFQIMSGQTLGITKINKNGLIQKFNSNRLISTGWTIITTVFRPYEIITDKDLLECLPNRLGDLTVYVNGREFWKMIDFEEFYCKPMDNTREKQIGVPFNISFGGGSFGLKHSWHYSGTTGNTLAQDNLKTNLKIEKHFSIPFKGGIQKLRIYDAALNSQEVLHNALIESENLGYALRITKGGRIIYQ
jgi:hypothetical protein